MVHGYGGHCSRSEEPAAHCHVPSRQTASVGGFWIEQSGKHCSGEDPLGHGRAPPPPMLAAPLLFALPPFALPEPPLPVPPALAAPLPASALPLLPAEDGASRDATPPHPRATSAAATSDAAPRVTHCTVRPR